MKKTVFIYLIIAALSISPASASNEDLVKLPKTITKSDGSYTKFEYDSQNRITKISRHENFVEKTETLTYGVDGSVKDVKEAFFDGEPITYIITKNGNKITLRSSGGGEYTNIITIDKDGYPTLMVAGYEESEAWTFPLEYQNGNLIKRIVYTEDGEEQVINYKYDDKKTPFTNCSTPKWWWWIMWWNHGDDEYCNKNNIIFENYIYEYDSDGFPTKRTEKNKDGSINVYTFIYTE